MEQQTVKHPTEGHVYVKGQVAAVTKKAILLFVKDKLKEGWVAKSLIQDDDVNGDFKRDAIVEIMIPDWVAGDRGFV